MSDLQLATGLAIMISGYITIWHGLSMYHWRMVVDLAWSATTTHLGTLTFLRNYFHNNPGERKPRIPLTLCLSSMLLVGIIPTAKYKSTENYSGVRAICGFSGPFNETERLSLVLQYCFIMYGIASRLIRLYPRSSKFMEKVGHSLENKLTAFFPRRKESSVFAETPFRRVLIYWPLMSVWMTILAFVDIISSQFFEVCCTN